LACSLFCEAPNPTKKTDDYVVEERGREREGERERERGVRLKFSKRISIYISS
jgi:hypothetical protein